ncbi:MAG: alanine/glycine:cation symporter family protein [Sphingomonadales bacterium]
MALAMAPTAMVAMAATASAAAEATLGLDARINAWAAPVLDRISAFVFQPIPGTPLPFIVAWLLAGAVFFTWRMGFVNLRGFGQALRVARGDYDNPSDPGEVTHFQALTAALSGTVGLGNIAGVAIAISLGGPGATFWMILAGLLGMSAKFTECTLAVAYRRIDGAGVVSGGPMWYLSAGLGARGWPRLGRALAVLFSLLCVGGALGAGNMFQVNQATQQFIGVFAPALGGGDGLFANPLTFGLIYAIGVGLIIVGGIRSIARVTARLVPVMAAIYLLASLVVIGVHVEQVGWALAEIIRGAFAPEAGVGGLIGVMVQGLRRAAFSNEAGNGSAAIAHAAAKTRQPVAEGLVALLEPFIDTVVICTITALVIILTGVAGQGGDGIRLTSNAFATVIGWFPVVLTVAVILFAFSTSISWYYYGAKSWQYLFGGASHTQLIYKAIYLAALLVGASATLTSVMNFADAMLLAMAFPNMIGLYVLSGEVRRRLDLYWQDLRTGVVRPYANKSP